MKVLNSVKSILRNEYLTYFIGFFTILFVMETLNNPTNNLLVVLRFTFSNRIIMIFSVLIIILIGYINIPLSLLLLTNYVFLLNINKKVETFNNRIPDLVDKNTQISYQKNFGKLKKKEEPKKSKIKKERDIPEEKTFEKPEKKEKKMVLSYVNKSDNEVSNERLDLEEKEYNIEKELQKIKRESNENGSNTLETDLEEKNYEIQKDYEALEDESSDSSESSESSDSSESSESSDSDGVNSISMDEAREHVMKKIRNKIKKKYVEKK